MEVLYSDCKTFNILGDVVDVISDETDYGQSTVIQFGDIFYYFGHEPPTLETALFAWQDLVNISLTDDQIDGVIKANASSAIITKE